MDYQQNWKSSLNNLGKSCKLVLYIIISWKYYYFTSMCGDSNVMLMTCAVFVYLAIFNCSIYKCIQSRKMWQDFFLNVLSNNVILFLHSNMRRDICYIYCPTNGIWYINRWIFLYKNKATIKIVWRLDNFEHLIIIQNKMDSRLRYLLFLCIMNGHLR